MKKLSRMLGVTLLEIMLVLAIAAMVVVMSIRYYSAATNSQQANSLLSQVLAISAAADNLAQGTGTFSATSESNVTAITGALYNPWGGTYTITGSASSYSFTLTGVPVAVCQSVAAKLAVGKTGSRYYGSGCAGTTISYQYSFTPKT